LGTHPPSLPWLGSAHLVADAVPLLSGLLNHHDQRVLEHVCLAFSRLVDDFGSAATQLEMLAAHSLLPHLHRLVSGMVAGGAAGDAGVSLSDTTYTMLLRTLAALCRGSGGLCQQLLELKSAPPPAAPAPRALPHRRDPRLALDRPPPPL
jgi:E3 ubiquitin-protein ligase TRIP12